MTQVQKIIKYLALALAIFLVVSIFSVILTGIYSLTGILGLNKEKNPNQKLQVVDCSNIKSNITKLKLDLDYTNLIIKTSSDFKLETTNSNIKCKVRGNKIKIIDKKNLFYQKTNTEKVIVTLPKELVFSEMEIDTGTGSVNIDKIVTNKLEMDLGTGKTTIKELVTNEAEIDTGAGEFTISSGTINNLDFDIGVGNVYITANIIGNSEIDSGVGNLELNILNKKENYRLRLKKGLGTIKVDNKEIKDDDVIGTGKNTLTIDGGIASIKINFKGE